MAIHGRSYSMPSCFCLSNIYVLFLVWLSRVLVHYLTLKKFGRLHPCLHLCLQSIHYWCSGVRCFNPVFPSSCTLLSLHCLCGGKPGMERPVQHTAVRTTD